MTRVLIVGGVAGGASAAARLRRLDEKAEIIMFERGNYISFANCGLPYHIGGEIQNRESLLVTNPGEMWDKYRIDVRINTEVVDIDRKNNFVRTRDENGEEDRVEYDKLLLSPGARALKPPIPGIDNDSRIFTLKTIPDMDKIIEFIKKNNPKNGLVVGAGYIGLEAAENLKNLGMETTIVEMLPQVMPTMDPEMAAIVQQHLVFNGIELILNDGVKKFEERNNILRTTLQSGKTVKHDFAIVAIGVRPEIELAKKSGLELGDTGSIRVDKHMLSSDPHIYAIGDAVEVEHYITGKPTWIALAGPAAKQGRIAADNISGIERNYSGSQGTAVVKVFDLCAGTTGLNELELKKNNYDYGSVIVHPFSHANYFPGSKTATIKLLFSNKDGKILGAQTIGEDGADKRIDVIGVAIRSNMTIWDLSELELAYSPPYGSAKDPVNMVGFVAGNIAEGIVDIVTVPKLKENLEDYYIIDVRDNGSYCIGHIEGSVNIPIQEIRDRLDEIPKSRKIAVYCKVGATSYVACRILKQMGHTRVYNVSGGWTTWSHFNHWQDTKPLSQMIGEETEGKGAVESDKSGETKKLSTDMKIDTSVCATGLQCPGPILKVSQTLKEMENNQVLEIEVSDPGFISDIKVWCDTTGNELLKLTKEDTIKALIRKETGTTEKDNSGEEKMSHDKTMVVFSGDLDKAIASFIIANGAASMGRKVTMFFTFWGLNILRKGKGAASPKPIMEKMFGKMMPKGADKLKLSKMNMMGLGTKMMKNHMKNKNIDSLSTLIQQAKEQGVRLVACQMTMDMMGFTKEELLDGVEIGGVATFIAASEQGDATLFI